MFYETLRLCVILAWVPISEGKFCSCYFEVNYMNDIHGKLRQADSVRENKWKFL